MRTLISTSLITLFLSACSTTQDPLPPTYYDYTLLTPNSEQIQVNQLPANLANADVILIGEWHTHTGIHRFQTDLLRELTRNNKTVALSMEQFSRDKQTVVDDYLAGSIGEQVLIKEGNAWPNYESDYRPLVEFAKAQGLEIIASNAPKAIVRCIGRQGVGYLNSLSDEERSLLASDIDISDSPYKEKFMASMHHGKPEQTERQFAAQVSWDETMADSIVRYLQQHPAAQVVHIAGKFHTEQGLGIKSSIAKRNPNLKVIVVTPIAMDSNLPPQGDDYWLKVLAPPVRYVQAENRLAAYQHLGKRNDSLTCQ
ncbi:hypothetical protein FCU94_04960 [Vibrio sp. JPW-9-11-11]|uniref:ChaN family lipoprotein n=1 Tax=Vibrio sp. JPW-9-11-11 TaxID=1416532 RepID=UPI001594690B|nr:ChaN family lipoprotein [Vibrio sp. JPW-9-11-11]NVD06259.1 hypothetical protein [Vibrio sp. JPW-9-11-11]